MTHPEITIVGGVYVEQCIRPHWDAVYGSGGRAAVAAAQLASTTLFTYVQPDLELEVQEIAGINNFQVKSTPSPDTIAFRYLHPLATPSIVPEVSEIERGNPIFVEADLVLRFGMMEGEAVVKAKSAVYDPQSAFGASCFTSNGSSADRLAVVLNRSEAHSMVGTADPSRAYKELQKRDGAEVMVLKMGTEGAFIIGPGGTGHVPAYCSENVWKIGSGDVFSSIFATLWGAYGLEPIEAARLASQATAKYCDDRFLGFDTVHGIRALNYSEANRLGDKRPRAYLAAPFFDLAQQWLVEETRHHLMQFGLDVFSPFHDIGPGPAHEVAPQDIDGLRSCDVLMALLIDMDPGTLFEVGYAVRHGIPVVAYAENQRPEDLKMLSGTGCITKDDYTSALYHTVWSANKR